MKLHQRLKRGHTCERATRLGRREWLVEIRYVPHARMDDSWIVSGKHGPGFLLLSVGTECLKAHHKLEQQRPKHQSTSFESHLGSCSCEEGLALKMPMTRSLSTLISSSNSRRLRRTRWNASAIFKQRGTRNSYIEQKKLLSSGQAKA